MPNDHRGRPLSGNYRSTPRLAKLLATTMTSYVRDAHQEAAGWYQQHGDDYSALDYANRPVHEFTPEQAQHYIEAYRTDRDAGYHGESRNEREYFINKAISERRK